MHTYISTHIYRVHCWKRRLAKKENLEDQPLHYFKAISKLGQMSSYIQIQTLSNNSYDYYVTLFLS